MPTHRPIFFFCHETPNKQFFFSKYTMFTQYMYLCNIFQASDRHLMIVQRLAVLCVGASATAISLSVPLIYPIFILAADIVYVIVLPQLTYAIYCPAQEGRTKTTAGIMGFLVGVLLRLGVGETSIGLPVLFCFLSSHSKCEDFVQSFPFRTTAMLCSAVTITVTFSKLMIVTVTITEK